MKMHKSLKAGNHFPDITVPKHGGGIVKLGQPQNDLNWQMVVIYRGKHCPMCTNYLKELEGLKEKYSQAGVDILAVSADSKERAHEQINLINPTYPVGYDLNIAQMHKLGLYISNPRAEAESDRPFAEPGVFIINEEGRVQIIDISNAPFARPDFNTLLGGINFVRNPDNNYPIRGTYDAS